jgi:hypothetical protein
MWWTEEEESFQALAEGAGAVPPQALPFEDDIANEHEVPAGIPWHIPVDEAVPQHVGHPITNGVAMDYEGALVAHLAEALAFFGPLEEDPPI